LVRNSIPPPTVRASIVRAPDVFAVLLEVREDVDLRIFLGRIAPARGGALDFPELLGKALQLAETEMLVGKSQPAVPAEREQDLAEVAFAQRLRQIDSANRRPEHRTGGSMVNIHASRDYGPMLIRVSAAAPG
jgi:hypothetical protein